MCAWVKGNKIREEIVQTEPFKWKCLLIKKKFEEKKLYWNNKGVSSMMGVDRQNRSMSTLRVGGYNDIKRIKSIINDVE